MKNPVLYDYEVGNVVSPWKVTKVWRNSCCSGTKKACNTFLISTSMVIYEGQQERESRKRKCNSTILAKIYHWGKIRLFIQICIGIWCLKNVNFMKNEILKTWILSKMWFLWKMRFYKCEFCQKWYFEKVNFVKNKILEMWILSKTRFSKCVILPQCG